MSDYVPDLTCIVRRAAPRRSWLASLKGEPVFGESTVICGRATVEQYLRCGYEFDWPATDAARSRHMPEAKAPSLA